MKYGSRFDHGCELNEPGSVAVDACDINSDLEREASLADATRSGKGYETPVTKQLGDCRALLIASDEGRELDWPVRTNVERHAWPLEPKETQSARALAHDNDTLVFGEQRARATNDLRAELTR